MYQVTFEAPGNPDFRQYAPIARPATYTAIDIAGLQAAARAYIARHDLGGGNFRCHPIKNTDTGEAVGRISYNGRFWPAHTAE